MKTVGMILLMLLTAIPIALGQRRLVVADVETLLPVAGANVQSLTGTVVTDSAGCFTATDSTTTLVVSHVNYETRIVNLDEMRDTVFVISKLLSLKEVVVFGKGRMDDDELKELNRQLRMARTEAELMQANPNQGINLIALVKWLIPKKWRTNKKEERRKRHERILEEY